jgi:transcriptional regulator with XRE-family HTH domain
MRFLSPAQCRAARGLLDWSQPDLAKKCGLHVQTICAFEHETGTPTKTTLDKITKAFEMNGVEFTANEGVRHKTTNIVTLEGESGFWEFYNDIYKTTSNDCNEILVSNVDEKDFDKWFGSLEKGMQHKKRMSELRKNKNFLIKILIQDGDYHFTVPEYAEYRWTSKKQFSSVPTYIYGTKKAEILFEKNNVFIFIIDHPKIAQTHKAIFDSMWDQAIRIPKDKIVTAKGLELNE